MMIYGLTRKLSFISFRSAKYQYPCLLVFNKTERGLLNPFELTWTDDSSELYSSPIVRRPSVNSSQFYFSKTTRQNLIKLC